MLSALRTDGPFKGAALAGGAGQSRKFPWSLAVSPQRGLEQQLGSVYLAAGDALIGLKRYGKP